MASFPDLAASSGARTNNFLPNICVRGIKPDLNASLFFAPFGNNVEKRDTVHSFLILYQCFSNVYKLFPQQIDELMRSDL